MRVPAALPGHSLHADKGNPALAQATQMAIGPQARDRGSGASGRTAAVQYQTLVIRKKRCRLPGVVCGLLTGAVAARGGEGAAPGQRDRRASCRERV